MEKFLLEGNQVKTGFLGDLDGGISGARISFEKSHRIAMIVTLNSAATDLNITFKQHTLASGGTTSDLVLKNKYYKKIGAATYFSQVASPDSANIVDADANGAVAKYVFEFLAEDLASGNTNISANIAHAASARIASIEYVAIDCKKQPSYAEVV